ncbi:MAG: phosphoglycerate mutase family protein [Bacteroidetes bacterium]|nr:phosphoglycerate mutase family protein [Bacteroidota bacterium]MDA0875353.1 phosphoglycerate mutase family protein [Bacteroidota bacterium]
MLRRLPLFALILMLMSCGSEAEPDGPVKTVYLVRHAEKCTEPAEDPGLTPTGQERARALRRTLQDVPIEAIFSTPLRRTRDTVEPLASALGLIIQETPIREGFLEALADTIRISAHGRIVVSGHSNTTARLTNLLAGSNLPDLEESQYDRLFVVHLGASGRAWVDVLRYGAPSGPSEPCG